RLRAARIEERPFVVMPGQRAVVYRDATGGYGFVVSRNRRRFFRLFAEMILTAVRIRRSFAAVQRAYRAAYPAMVSEAYWQRQFRPVGRGVQNLDRSLGLQVRE